MTMTIRFSRLMLTSHITFSVGWLGAVAVFLALAVTGLTSGNIQLVRAAYLAMELSAWFIIVPFCFASLVTGIIQALTTKWGLFKHYWILVKLLLTIAATILLLLHIQPISYMAGIAAEATFSKTQLPALRIQLIADAGAALLLLLAATTISVYKPWGRIRYTVRESYQQGMAEEDKKTTGRRSMGFYVLMGLIGLVLLTVIMHLFGGGMTAH